MGLFVFSKGKDNLSKTIGHPDSLSEETGQSLLAFSSPTDLGLQKIWLSSYSVDGHTIPDVDRPKSN